MTKENIKKIYDTVDEKTKLMRAAAVEFDMGESTFQRMMIKPEYMPDDESKLKSIHSYVFNWRKLEIERNNKILLENS